MPFVITLNEPTIGDDRGDEIVAAPPRIQPPHNRSVLVNEDQPNIIISMDSNSVALEDEENTTEQTMQENNPTSKRKPSGYSKSFLFLASVLPAAAIPFTKESSDTSTIESCLNFIPFMAVVFYSIGKNIETTRYTEEQGKENKLLRDLVTSYVNTSHTEIGVVEESYKPMPMRYFNKTTHLIISLFGCLPVVGAGNFDKIEPVASFLCIFVFLLLHIATAHYIRNYANSLLKEHHELTNELKRITESQQKQIGGLHSAKGRIFKELLEYKSLKDNVDQELMHERNQNIGLQNDLSKLQNSYDHLSGVIQEKEKENREISQKFERARRISEQFQQKIEDITNEFSKLHNLLSRNSNDQGSKSTLRSSMV